MRAYLVKKPWTTPSKTSATISHYPPQGRMTVRCVGSRRRKKGEGGAQKASETHASAPPAHRALAPGRPRARFASGPLLPAPGSRHTFHVCVPLLVASGALLVTMAILASGETAAAGAAATHATIASAASITDERAMAPWERWGCVTQSKCYLLVLLLFFFRWLVSPRPPDRVWDSYPLNASCTLKRRHTDRALEGVTHPASGSGCWSSAVSQAVTKGLHAWALGWASP